MARRAQSYSCPFCSRTSETRKNAQVHLITKHLMRLASKYLRTTDGALLGKMVIKLKK